MGTSVTISAAGERDAEQILKLQYLCFQSEAERYGDYGIAPLTETQEEFRAQLARTTVLVARLGEEIVGAVRASLDEDGTVSVGRLIVHPRLQRHGLGGRLLAGVEQRLAEAGARRYRLVTGGRSEGNQRLYRRYGYTPAGTERDRDVVLLTMVKDAAEPAGV
ncbi:GNAT family N-acetyltransferase [Streptomyces sulphureus]|uniref:GNAT family N-acetyltransferase n=1 Tax=Streptomyces sulphureus TaxID=47758 RepID=UPI000377E517|nr:GNAT family N-acetyltransferase [Streptomyces sulphureus]